MDYYLGLDIGGSSIKNGLEDAEGQLILFSSIPLRERSLAEFRAITRDILHICQSYTLDGAIAAIGIGSPGQIDHRRGIIIGNNPNLPFWTMISPTAIMPEDLDLKVVFDNDANLMALGEASHYPAGHNVLGVTIGSGIGCGFCIGGKVFGGSRGYAMELGHITSIIDGAACNCGRYGCLEAYSSLNGMRNRLCEIGYKANDWNFVQLLQAAELDKEVKAILDKGIELFSLALANLMIILEPDHLVIGGGASEIPLYPVQELIDKIQSLLPPELTDISIDLAKQGNKAGVLGAIRLARG